MAILLPGAYNQLAGTSVTAQYERLDNAFHTRSFPSSATNGNTRLDGQGGVWPQPNALNTTASGTPDMNVHVDRGHGFMQGSQDIAQGNYPFHNGASLTVAITAANTQQRIDSIVVHTKDTFYTGAVDTTEIVSIAGTPGSGTPPNLAALDNNYFEFARVTVRANTTSILNTDIQNIQHTLPVGLDIPLSSEFSNVGSFLGHPRVNTNVNGGLEWWDTTSTTWRSGQRIAGGDFCNGVTGISTTETAICTTTVNLDANSVYKIVGYARLGTGTAGDEFVVRLRQTTITGTQLDADEVVLSPQAHGGGHVEASVITTTAQTGVVYIMSVLRLAGAGSCTAQGNSNLIVQKLGHTGIVT